MVHMSDCLCAFMLCQIKHSFCELLTLSFYFSYGTATNSKTIKNSRLVSQKDDVHVCIMCLRAIMNYQVQDAQTWLITKTSGTSELFAHRKEAANKNNSPSFIIKCHRTWQVTCYSPEYFSVCPVYKQQHVYMESPLHCGKCFFNTYTTLLFPFSP